MTETTTLYLSKYALSTGKITAGQYIDRGTGFWRPVGDRDFTLYRLGRDVHGTADEALAAAEKARIAKAQSLLKQITKLEKLRFKVES